MVRFAKVFLLISKGLFFTRKLDCPGKKNRLLLLVEKIIVLYTQLNNFEITTTR